MPDNVAFNEGSSTFDSIASHSWLTLFLTLILAAACHRLWCAEAAFEVSQPSSSPSKTCEKPCRNGGSCVNGNCVCAPGWTGVECDSCFGRIRRNGSSDGVISDGPTNYAAAARCTWVIDGAGDDGGPLLLRLDDFFTECCWDNVYVYDGDGVYGQLLAAFSGSISGIEVVARSGKALVYFTSDLAFNLPGFNISYTHNACPYNCSGHGHCKSSGQCRCDKGFIGDYCQMPICLEEMSGERGPCKKSSVCKARRCECTKHTHGDLCQELSTTPVWDTLAITDQQLFTPRASHASSLMDDELFIFGGLSFNSPKSEGGDSSRSFGFTTLATNEMIALNLKDGVIHQKKATTTAAIQAPNLYDHTMVEFGGKFYIFGGVTRSGLITNDLWSFDPVTLHWALVSARNDSDSATPTDSPMAVADRDMYVFFGYNPFEGFIFHLQIYSFETNRWRRVSVDPTVAGRFGHSSVLYKDEADNKNTMVLLYGGYNAPLGGYSYALSDELLLYNVKGETWTSLPNSGIPLFRHAAAILDGIMLVVGGNSHNESSRAKQRDCYSSRLLAYDIVCKEWIKITVEDTRHVERYGHAAVATGANIYVVGGFNGIMHNDVLKFTPALCNSQAMGADECKETANGVRCVYQNKICKKAEANTSYLQPFLSFIKGGIPRLKAECMGNLDRVICADSKECVDCLFRKGCGWCENNQRCQRSDTSCADGLLTDRDRCPLGGKKPTSGLVRERACSSATNCFACRQLRHCSWFAIDRVKQHIGRRGEDRFACIALRDEALLAEESKKTERGKVLSRITPDSSIAKQHSLSPTSLMISGQRSLTEEDAPELNQTCPAPCFSNQDCKSCVDALCMWCSSMKRCVPVDTYMISFPYGQCQSWVSAAGGNRVCSLDPHECGIQKTCAECQLIGPRCGWCDDGSGTGLGICMAGSSSGPVKPGACSAKNWYFTGEPSCQCNGHSTCTDNATIQQQRKCRHCENRTRGDHCEFCENGYYGDPRNGGTCKPCECNGESRMCNSETGACYCATKGVTGKRCDRCEPKYVGDAGSPPCYYELITDFIFTFKLDGEDVKYVNRINFLSTPSKRDTDVQFSVTCEGDSGAKLYINLTSMTERHRENTKQMMAGQVCGPNGIRRTYSSSDPGFLFGSESNTTFYVRVSDFSTPIRIQISFAQSPPINWVLFFVIFAACFIVLLVVAGLLWMIKLRVEWYRNIRRRHDEIEEMASRPFASVQLEFNSNYANPQATPIAVEPCGNHQAGIYTFVVKLPTGGCPYTPHGTSGLAMASTLCCLTQTQLALLQPDASQQLPKQKSILRRLISPFMRRL